MAPKTIHVIPTDRGWTVKKAGRRATGVYPTQKEAVKSARELAQRAPAGQVVVHGVNGHMRTQEVHGLPAVQAPPQKSTLGSKAIEKAVSTVIRERLAGE